MRRRDFLKAAAAGSTASLLGPAAWTRLYAAPPTPGPGPYGALRPADANGLMLPAGFRSRVIARSLLLVPGTLYPWKAFPDGSACFPTSNGGWILVVNSESPPPVIDLPIVLPRLLSIGGVSAIRFSSGGQILGAYPILTNTRSNCAGGATPWGTWLSCEEFDGGPGPPRAAGQVWECYPDGNTPAKVRPKMGSFSHEAAAVDPVNKHVYLTEDRPDGCFYRYTPANYPNLSNGVLAVAQVAGTGAVTWHTIPDPQGAQVEVRNQVAAATHFGGGEGCLYDAGHVYFTTKDDNRVWKFNVASQTLGVLYNAAHYANPILTGVDNIIVSKHSGDIYVAEDGGNMEVNIITPEGQLATFARATGIQHLVVVAEGLPLASEISGLAFTPNGKRLYFHSQRAFGVGVTYEVTGPFRLDAPVTSTPMEALGTL